MRTQEVPIGALYRRVERSGREDLPLLSVYRDLGVVLREGREDNFNRASEDLSRYKVVQVGDLVLNKMKTWQGSLGVSAFHGIVSPAYFVAQRRGSIETDNRFLHHLLRSMPLIAEYGARSKGIRPAQWDLPWDEFAAIHVDIPPIEEQRAIADYLDAETARIDALIEKKLALVELLEARRTTTVSAAFPGDILMARDGRPLGFVKASNVRLGALANVQTGLTLDAGREVGSVATPLPYLRVANVQDGSLLLTDVKEVVVPPDLARRCALRRGDVLMTEGGDPDKLGRGAVWHGTIEPCLHQNHIFAVRPGDALDPEYLALLTRTPYGRAYFEMTASKTTGIASTSTTKIAGFRVPLLPLHRQREIVEETAASLSVIDRTETQLRRQMDLLKEHRQALVTAAVTGEAAVAA